MDSKHIKYLSKKDAISAAKKLIKLTVPNEEHLKIKVTDRSYVPYYLCSFSINAIFKTSVGVIHSIDDSSAVGLWGPTVKENNLIWDSEARVPETNLVKGPPVGKKKPLGYNSQKIVELIAPDLIRRYSANINYTGGNRVNYTKFCAPRAKDIRFEINEVIYFPLWEFEVDYLGKKYVLSALQKGDHFTIFNSDLNICGCGKKSEMFCSLCGDVVCRKHSEICEVCRKPVCSNCFSTIGRLPFRKKICNECKNDRKLMANLEKDLKNKNMLVIGSLAILAIISLFLGVYLYSTGFPLSNPCCCFTGLVTAIIAWLVFKK